MSVFGTAIHG